MLSAVAWPITHHKAFRSVHQIMSLALDLVSLKTRVLVDGAGSYEEPSFSPDDRRLVFSTRRSGSGQIFAFNVDGSGFDAADP